MMLSIVSTLSKGPLFSGKAQKGRLLRTSAALYETLNDRTSTVNIPGANK